jgi:hypothetical protein
LTETLLEMGADADNRKYNICAYIIYFQV